jgi:hypothetical protein
MLNKIDWKENTLLLDNLEFALQVHLKDDKRNETTGFVFYKDKKLIDMYEAFFKSEHYPKIERMLEIGMWDGGSAVFWHKLLQPSTLIGVDLMKSRKGTAFETYKKLHQDSFHDYWEVDQTDRKRLKEILKTHLGEQDLDLVFDDASHRYHQSLASFNIVFPHVKKGGYYIIEDWAWVHWLHEDSSAYPDYTEPTRLIFELVEAAGNVGLIESIHVCSGFTAVKRGSLDIPKEGFQLHDYIKRRPVSLKSRVKRRIKMLLGRSW